MKPLSHFAETEANRRQRRTTFLAYPKYYRAPDGAWRETRETLAASPSGYLAEATEGVHTLRVASDGTLVMGHLGGTITQLLVGIAAVNPAGEPSRILDIDLRKCPVTVEGNIATWHHPDGYRYEVFYVADRMIDRLHIPIERFATIRKFLPKGCVAFGPAFEFDEGAWQSDAAAKSEAAGLAWRQNGRVKHSIRPARVNATMEHPGWAKRRILRRANRLLVEAIPTEALDGSEPLVFNATVTYQEGTDSYSGCLDTFIYASSSTTNYGTDPSLFTGYRDGSHLAIRSLIKFDLNIGEAGFPAAADTINSATLSLWVEKQLGTSAFYRASDDLDGTVNAHRVLRDWLVGQATWNIYSTGNNWSTAGAAGAGTDIANAATDTCTAFSYNDCDKWVTWDVKSDVAAFVAGTTCNYGWRMCTDLDAVPTVWRPPAASSDYGTTNLRPKLTVDYTAGAAGGNPWYHYQRNAMRRAN